MSCDLANGRLEVCKDAVGGIDAVYFINYGDYAYPADLLLMYQLPILFLQ
jgi:hypothetical protein